MSKANLVRVVSVVALVLLFAVAAVAKQPCEREGRLQIGMTRGQSYHARLGLPTGHTMGSCVLVGTRHVVTCAHCITSSTQMEVKIGDKVYGCKLDAIDFDRDWALLELDAEVKDIKPVRLSDEKPKAGDWVYGYGFGGGYFGVTAMQIQKDGRMRGRIVPGDSGGAILDSKGRLLGLVSSYMPSTGDSTVDPLAFGNDLGDLKAFVEKYIDNDRDLEVHEFKPEKKEEVAEENSKPVGTGTVLLPAK